VGLGPVARRAEPVEAAGERVPQRPRVRAAIVASRIGRNRASPPEARQREVIPLRKESLSEKFRRIAEALRTSGRSRRGGRRRSSTQPLPLPRRRGPRGRGRAFAPPRRARRRSSRRACGARAGSRGSTCPSLGAAPPAHPSRGTCSPPWRSRWPPPPGARPPDASPRYRAAPVV
jgi:hypothetical protein